MSLHPTKTRLALLQAVADGRVWLGRWFPYDSFMEPAVGEHYKTRTVTSRCDDQERAGWLIRPTESDGPRALWRLTPYGSRILAGDLP